MKLIGKIINNIEDYLLVILMIVLPIVVFLQIVLRLTGGDLSWTEETARYLFIWVIYVGAARGVRTHSELSVDAVRHLTKENSTARAIFDLVTKVLCTIFAGIFFLCAIEMVQNFVVRPKYSAACGYNMVYVYSASIIAAFLMFVRYLIDVYKGIIKVINTRKGVVQEGEIE